MKKLKLFFCTIIIFIVPLAVAAMPSSEFIFQVNVGGDTTPPTTPVLQSVTPVSPNQIDIQWGPSTDNWVFGGYVLLRNGLPIATTTLQSYSDMGLTPETLYTYEVYAFDAGFNISSTSNSLATMTLPVVIPPPPAAPDPVGVRTGTQLVQVTDFSIVPDTQAVVVSWETNRPTRTALRWGKTDAYTGGFSVSEVSATRRVITITDLEPGTRYYFELVGFTPSGQAIVLRTGEFTTTTTLPARVMPNVERLTVTVSNGDVTLRYRLPAGETDARVRVVRSHLGWPRDRLDGAVVYEGTNDTVVDRDVFSKHETQYYTVFAIGADGTISSGAVVTARLVPREPEVIPPSLPLPITPPSATTTPTTTPLLPTEPELPRALELLSPEVITLLQNGRINNLAEETITLDKREAFTIRIAATALPPHLKSIVVTLLDPTNQRQQYSFILRLNNAGDAYEATISALGVAGASRLQVEIYDYKQMVVGRYAVPINFAVVTETAPPVLFPDALVSVLAPGWTFLLTLIVIIFISGLGWWLYRRKTEDKN